MLLPLRPPYRPEDAHVLLCAQPEPVPEEATATAGAAFRVRSYVIAPLSAAPRWARVESLPMNQGRRHGLATLLPDGSVLLVGGVGKRGGQELRGGDGDLGAALEAELFVPDQAEPHLGTWTRLARSGVARNYHAIALLLPDGSVLVGGSSNEGESNGWQRAEGPWDPDTRTRDWINDTRELRFEIFRPPYLFAGPRPVVSDVRVTDFGRSLTITTLARPDLKLVLARHGVATHGWDGDQRIVELRRIGPVSSDAVRCALPRDRGVLPPGPYMVFVLAPHGVPGVPGTGYVPSLGRSVILP